MKEEKNSNSMIVKESQDIFQRFDEIDDEIIIAEIENRIVDDWVYHFRQGGKDVWGIGKQGIDGCVSELGKKGIALREEDVKCMSDPTNAQYMLFQARVSKHFIGKDGAEAMVESAIGTKRQWTKIIINGKIVENKFWYEQGTIKALRNAKSRLIPDEIKAKIIAFAKKHQKVKTIEPRKSEQSQSEGVELAMPAQITDIQRMEATLVDNHKYDPFDLTKELQDRYGFTDIQKISRNIAAKMIEYLEGKLRKGEGKQEEKKEEAQGNLDVESK